MARLVVDSWAWIEYFSGSEMGRKADEAMRDSSELWTSVATIAEVVSKYRRSRREEGPAIRAITTLSRVGVPTLEDALDAGKIHSELKANMPNFSFADSFVLQLARKVNGRVLTGDPDFEGVKEADLIGASNKPNR